MLHSRSTRRPLLTALAAAALTSGVMTAVPTQAQPPPAQPPPAQPTPVPPAEMTFADTIPTADLFPLIDGSQLRWQPDFAAVGLDAFAGTEDDRSDSHPGVQHIFPMGDMIRFEIHLVDREGSDRQRTEVKGMHANGQDIEIGAGQTWVIRYSMYIPDSLQGTTSFTHIMQLKQRDKAAPLLVMSLRRRDDEEVIELRAADAGVTVGSTPLPPLRNKWISSEVVVTAADHGMLRWTLLDGAQTVFTGQQDDVDVWAGDTLRPKWGIYRSLGDREHLADTYLLLANIRAYQTGGPPADDGSSDD